jgi:hypothetical protein
MPFLSQRPKLKLTDEEFENLTSLSASRTKPLREIERAKIRIPFKLNGKSKNTESLLMHHFRE